MPNKPLPTQERLKEKFDYNPDTGLFINRAGIQGAGKVGKPAGIKRAHGYTNIGVDYGIFLAHRLAWMYVYGEDPGELVIDHINGDPSDNRITNLRAVTKAENNRNLSMHRVSATHKCKLNGKPPRPQQRNLR